MARGPAKDKVAVIAPAVAVNNSEHDDLVRKRDAVSIHPSHHPRPSPHPKMRLGLPPTRTSHSRHFLLLLSFLTSLPIVSFLLFLLCGFCNLSKEQEEGKKREEKKLILVPFR